MSGHGHITPNADGSKARCGGPAICSICAKEAAACYLPGCKHVDTDCPLSPTYKEPNA